MESLLSIYRLIYFIKNYRPWTQTYNMDNQGLNDYQILSAIGIGGFATVYCAQHNITKTKVALKVMNKNPNNPDGMTYEKMMKEIDIMKKVKHPFIAQYFETIETDDYIYIVQEFAKNGTLLDVINQKGPFSEQEAARIFAQLALAIQYLHKELHIAHRDIKAENILFDGFNNIRLIDFGLSHFDADQEIMKTQCGSPTYAAPEVIIGIEYTYSCDIWSLGVVLFAMICGYLPFVDENMQRLMQKIIYKEVEFPPYISNEAQNLISLLLAKKYKTRITIDEVLQHPFIARYVNMYNDKIMSYVPNNEFIFGTLELLDVDKEKTKSDLQQGLVTSNSVSYKIIYRVVLNETLNSGMICGHDLSSMGRQRRRASYNDMDVLPPLEVKEAQYSTIRRTNHINNSIIHNKRRKYPLPQYHLTFKT